MKMPPPNIDADISCKMRSAVLSLSRHVFPIYVKSQNSNLVHVGTGFFVNSNSRVFLITAHHCIKFFRDNNPASKFADEVVIAFDSTVHTLSGRMNFKHTNDNELHPAHTLDITSLEVTAAYPFYNSALAHSICQSHLVEKDLPDQRVSVVGFINKRNSNPLVKRPNDEETKLKATINVFVDYPIISDFNFSTIGKLPVSHHAVYWPLKDANKQQIAIPKGLSGAPVWHFEDPTRTETASVVGVLIEHYRTRRITIVTRTILVRLLLEMAYGL